MTRRARRTVAAIGAAAAVACAGVLALAVSPRADGPSAGANSASRHPPSAAASGSARPTTAPASSAATPPAPASPAASWGGPQGFWLGTDSSEVATPGSGPYQEPAVGGAYGGYIGMIGNWADWQQCGGQVVWSAADSNSAHANYVTYHSGIGVAGYWFMAGPGVDPNYDGTAGEAAAWGTAQAAQLLAELPEQPTPVNYPVIFMDVEIPGHAPSFTPAPDNGWTAVYTAACSGQVRQNYMLPSLNRADLDGFASYLTTHSAYLAGVYSAPSIWTTIFGTNPADANIPNTYEWTYDPETSSLSQSPDGWCVQGTGTCAQFFGGQTSSSPYALMWQWSGGGGVRNGYGDFDQIDASRTP
jgi:hypothetical protein